MKWPGQVSWSFRKQNNVFFDSTGKTDCSVKARAVISVSEKKENMEKYVCVHGHFYQPPRENPWLERVEKQDSAYPYHDWNERITAECYEPNTASRILSEYQRIVDIVNNYSKMSFNFGPTLLSWLEKHSPQVYEAILEADKTGQKHFSGYGPAISQAYNHMILPLANARDKETQVIWGIKDFEYRFGRKPEGMWLPETAVDTESLEVLAENGIKFTILAPRQAKAYRKKGEEKWTELNGKHLDPRIAYSCNLPSGKNISLFFYDGPVSQALAFEGLLKSGKDFADRLTKIFSEKDGKVQLAHIATDGESYGHHHRHGDMALAFCLDYIEKHGVAKLTNYGEFLEKYPPEYEISIHEESSWSCAHGIERWKSNCGCKMTGDPKITQEWRYPLRKALDWLRDSLIPVFENQGALYLKDPWKARNEYIQLVLNRNPEEKEKFYKKQAKHELSDKEKITVNKLLEMQRHTMLMYTSCGWFFDDISRIETIQILTYAARAMQLANDVSAVELEKPFLKMLENAPGNYPNLKNGAVVYEKYVLPAVVDITRVCAHYAMSSLFVDEPEEVSLSFFKPTPIDYKKITAGEQKLATGKVRILSEITGEEELLAFAVIHLGDHNLIGGVKECSENQDCRQFQEMVHEIEQTFHKNDISAIIHLLDKYFGTHKYSFWHLFKDEQREIINSLLKIKFESVESIYRQLFKNNYMIMQVMKDFDMSLPDALTVPAEFVLNQDLSRLISEDMLNIDELERIANEIEYFDFQFDKPAISLKIKARVDRKMRWLRGDPGNMELLEKLESLFSAISKIGIRLDLWKAQNLYFLIYKENFHKMAEKAQKADKKATEWIQTFKRLEKYMEVKVIKEEG